MWTYNHGSFREFEYIQTVGLNRMYNGTSKGFAGTVEAKLTSKTKIWWHVNGDFYNNGTTTVSITGGGSAAKIGKTVTGNFSISVTHTSDHYRYWNNSGTYSIY